jgi:hypothetical protein
MPAPAKLPQHNTATAWSTDTTPAAILPSVRESSFAA